jgi:hypothetical protein
MVAFCLRLAKLEPRDEPSGFALDGLAIDQEAEPLLEGERSNSGLLSLLLERLGHAEETEGYEPVASNQSPMAPALALPS